MKNRGAGTLSGVPSTSTAAAALLENESNKPKDEIIKLFFDSTDSGISRGIYQEECGCMSIRPQTSNDDSNRGFDSSKPQGFAEHLSLILRKTPTILGPSKPEFWPNFILGSLYTIPQFPNIKKDIYTKVEKIDVLTPQGHNTVNTKILKICFKQNDHTLVLKTFIAEDHKINSNKGYTENDMKNFRKNLMLEGRYSQSELDAMSTKLGITHNYQIVESIFYIATDHSLSVKELSKTNNNYQHKPPGSGEFQKIEYTDIDLKHLEDLASNNIDNVMFGIKTISQGLLQVYNSLKMQDTSKKGKSKFKKENKFGFEIKSEAAFQGFLYGILSLNFKYHYYLDIYVERIAGKGYADLILLSRKDNSHNKNWRAIPIVIEFKADETSSASAIDQAKGTGYLYNLSMRTISDQAVIVGINSKIDSDDVDKAINIKRENIPQPEGLINPLIRNMHDSTKTHANIRSNIEKELKHLYYSISNLAIKTDDNYLSRLILGEFLSEDGVEKLYVHNAGNTVTTFVFQAKNSNGWIMLNLVESSNNGKFQDVNLDKIKLPNNVQINSLTKIDIKVNHNSKLGWSPDERIRTDDKTKGKDDKKLYFFQNIEVFDHRDVSRFIKIHDYKKLTSTLRIANFFSRGNINTELEELSKSLISVQDMVNSESDFQAILHGTFFGKHDQLKTIKVLPEANPSKSGRIDLLICRREYMGSDVPQDEYILIMELKYAKDKKDSENKLNDANKQILKYISNLKSITDSRAIIPITLVFNKAANIAKDVIEYEVHANKDISHTSNPLSNSQTLQELADYLQKSHDDISSSQLDKQTFDEIEKTVNELAQIMAQPGAKTFFDKINKTLREIALSNLDTNNQNSANFADKNKINFLKKRLNDLLELVKNTQQFNPMTDSHNQPSNKKQKIDNRRTRSLNYIKEYQNISNMKISNTSSLVEGESHIVLNQEKTIDTENSSFNVASSGVSSRLQFWPINLMENLGILISSIVSVSWISDIMNYKPSESLSLLQADLPVKQHPSLNQCETVPTLLKMGDQWLNNTDMNGFLTVGILLVRKWTGCKPQSSELLSDNQAISRQLDIQSATLVDAFQKLVLKHARSCGIRSCISDNFEDSALYCKTIQQVRNKLAIGKIAAIPHLLYQQLVQNNIKKVSSKSTQAQANQLLARLADDIPNLQQKFLDYEQECLSYRKLAVKTMASQVCCNNIKRANVGILSQAISSMQQSEQLAQFPAVMTTKNNSEVFTNLTGVQM
ncbi:hypothetical protein HUJ04_000457 [Dendroctonus ponderosae]|nr:hypothetical protein HUJ04_000457 [Dendroctonus ponderosae]